jgi:hypothetical protein
VNEAVTVAEAPSKGRIGIRTGQPMLTTKSASPNHVRQPACELSVAISLRRL